MVPMRRSSRSLNFPIAVGGLNQPQLPDITGQRNLCRGNTERSQFLSELFLSLNSAVPDQTQNLSLPVRLVHPIRLSLSSASARASATVSGAVPPCTVRVFMPSAGWKSLIISGVNSGSKATSSSALQSDGRLPDRTLSSTRRPTI